MDDYSSNLCLQGPSVHEHVDVTVVILEQEFHELVQNLEVAGGPHLDNERDHSQDVMDIYDLFM